MKPALMASGLLALALVACDPTEMADSVPVDEVKTRPVGTTEVGVDREREPSRSGEPRAVKRALARLSPTSDSKARGTARFEQTPDGVRVTLDVAGLAPGEAHRFYVFDNGDCGAAQAAHMVARVRGEERGSKRASRDASRIEADASGQARFDGTLDGMTLRGDRSIVGRALVIHRADDGPQPGGEAPIACAVIGIGANEAADGP